jgi:hypothetical protein
MLGIMKRFYLVLVTLFFATAVFAVQPLRKPFIQLKVDGKPYKNGEILTVSPGQKMKLEVNMEGGRRDFCKFPDTYADIAGTAQILSRGKDGLVYQLDGAKSEWKLLNESVRFTSDEFAKADPQSGYHFTEVTISSAKFSQTFLKVAIHATWQFEGDGETVHEENVADGTVYFKAAGASDVWFLTPNVMASGIKDNRVEEKLVAVQAACDSVEHHFYDLDFPAVQQAVRNLQAEIGAVKLAIDEVKKGNASYQTKIAFIGLPSDKPFANINALSTIKNDWLLLETSVPEIKDKLAQLPAQPTKESNNELVALIAEYADWLRKLPENTFEMLSLYIPDIHIENIKIPANIQLIAEEKTVGNYPQTIDDFTAFLDQRIENVPLEVQKINSAQTRLQAVRLFDGMLRSYFSSINWAEWRNTRE